MRESKRKALTLISAARQGVHKKICKEKLDDSVGEKDEAYPPVSCQDRIALGNYTEELLAMKSEVVDRRPAFRHTEDIQNRTTLCHIGRGSEFMLGIWHLVTAGSSVKDCDQAMNHDFSSQTCPFCYVTMLLHSSIIQYLEHVLKFLFNSPMFGAWGFRLLGGTTFTQIEHMSNFLRDLQSGQNCEKELMICSVCRAFVFLKPPVTKGTERRLQRQKESFIACHMASHGFRDVRSNGEKPSVLIVLPSVSIRLLCNVCFNVSFCMMSWHKHVTLHSITSSHERSVSGSDNSKKWRLSEGSYVRIGPDLNMRNIRKDDVIFYNFSSPLCPVCLENLEKHGLFDLFTHRMQVLFKQNKNHSGTFVKLRFHSKSSPEFIYNSLVGFTEAVIYECESTATSKENWDIFICSVCSCWDVVENIRECCPHPGLLTGKQKLVITSHIEAHDVGRQKLSQKPSLVIEIPSGLVKAICSVCYATFLCIADWRYHLNWHVTDMASSVSAVTKDTTSPEFHTVLSPGREIEQYETQEMKSLAVRQDRRKQTSIKKRKTFLQAQKLRNKRESLITSRKDKMLESESIQKKIKMKLSPSTKEVSRKKNGNNVIKRHFQNNNPVEWKSVTCIRYLMGSSEGEPVTLQLILPVSAFESYEAKGCIALPVQLKVKTASGGFRMVDDVLCLLRESAASIPIIFSLTQSLRHKSSRHCIKTPIEFLLNNPHCKYLKVIQKKTKNKQNKERTLFSLRRVTSGLSCVQQCRSSEDKVSNYGNSWITDSGSEASQLSTFSCSLAETRISNRNDEHLSGGAAETERHIEESFAVLSPDSSNICKYVQRSSCLNTSKHSVESQFSEEKRNDENLRNNREIILIYKTGESNSGKVLMGEKHASHSPVMTGSMQDAYCLTNEVSSGTNLEISHDAEEIQNAGSKMTRRTNRAVKNVTIQNSEFSDLSSRHVDNVECSDDDILNEELGELQHTEVHGNQQADLKMIQSVHHLHDEDGLLHRVNGEYPSSPVPEIHPIKPVFVYTEMTDANVSNDGFVSGSGNKRDVMAVCVYKEPEYDSSTDSADETPTSEERSIHVPLACSSQNLNDDHLFHHDNTPAKCTNNPIDCASLHEDAMTIGCNDETSSKNILHNDTREVSNCSLLKQILDSPVRNDNKRPVVVKVICKEMSQCTRDLNLQSTNHIPDGSQLDDSDTVEQDNSANGVISPCRSPFKNDEDNCGGLKITSAYSLAKAEERELNPECGNLSTNISNVSGPSLLKSPSQSAFVFDAVDNTRTDFHFAKARDTSSLASPVSKMCNSALPRSASVNPPENNAFLTHRPRVIMPQRNLFKCTLCSCVFESKTLLVNHKLLHKIAM